MELMGINEEDLNYFTINEKNIKLQDEDRCYIKSRLNRLAELVPIHSSIILGLSRRKNLFYGDLKVKSLKCDFFSKRKNFNLISLFEMLEGDIYEQISSWKSMRFKNKNIILVGV